MARTYLHILNISHYGEEGVQGQGQPPQLVRGPFPFHTKPYSVSRKTAVPLLLSLIVYTSNTSIPHHHASVLYIGVVFVYRQ